MSVQPDVEDAATTAAAAAAIEAARFKPGLSTSDEMMEELRRQRTIGKKTGKPGKDGKPGKVVKLGFVAGTYARSKLLLSVAEKWEKVFLGIAPLLFIGVALLHSIGVPLPLVAYGVIFLAFYSGWHFAIWVFLDRRLDEQNWLRFKNAALRLMNEKDQRDQNRRDAALIQAAAVKRAEAARERGRRKAAEAAAAAGQ